MGYSSTGVHHSQQHSKGVYGHRGVALAVQTEGKCWTCSCCKGLLLLYKSTAVREYCVFSIKSNQSWSSGCLPKNQSRDKCKWLLVDCIVCSPRSKDVKSTWVGCHTSYAHRPGSATYHGMPVLGNTSAANIITCEEWTLHRIQVSTPLMTYHTRHTPVVLE